MLWYQQEIIFVAVSFISQRNDFIFCFGVDTTEHVRSRQYWPAGFLFFLVLNDREHMFFSFQMVEFLAPRRKPVYSYAFPPREYQFNKAQVFRVECLGFNLCICTLEQVQWG
ncbi:hypothetical protein Droror1_Dr00015976 [Drosera rotundifolia]